MAFSLCALRPRLTGLRPAANGKLHASCTEYAASGIRAVSGMLLIMKGFVRINPDKKGHCNAYGVKMTARANSLPSRVVRLILQGFRG
jgi:hypothetical protein